MGSSPPSASRTDLGQHAHAIDHVAEVPLPRIPVVPATEGDARTASRSGRQACAQGRVGHTVGAAAQPARHGVEHGQTPEIAQDLGHEDVVAPLPRLVDHGVPVQAGQHAELLDGPVPPEQLDGRVHDLRRLHRDDVLGHVDQEPVDEDVVPSATSASRRSSRPVSSMTRWRAPTDVAAMSANVRCTAGNARPASRTPPGGGRRPMPPGRPGASSRRPPPPSSTDWC